MSFSEWKKVLLNDVCKEITVGYVGSMASQYIAEGIPFLRSLNVDEFNINMNELRYISEDFHKKLKKSALTPGDVVIVRTGKPGTCSVIPNWLTTANCSDVVIVRVDKEIDPYFLSAYMNSIGKGHVYSHTVGAVQQHFNVASAKKLKINLPPLEEQKAIVKVLSDLDKKIETNNRINKKLEEMAQAIFKQWFIDFEFPNEEGKPYKSSGGEMVESELGMIPKGWVVTSLNDIVDIFNGYSYKGKELSESKDAMITIKNFDRNGGYKVDGLKEIVISDKVKPHHYVEINDIIVAHTDLTQGAEIIGNPILVHSKGKYDKLIMSMDTVKVKSKIKEINNALLYFILKDYRFKQYALGYVNGTTVLHLSKSTIPQYNIAVPTDKSLMIQLGNCLSSVMSKVANNVKENEKLISIRDTLLPKLMSGEIRVPLD